MVGTMETPETFVEEVTNSVGPNGLKPGINWISVLMGLVTTHGYRFSNGMLIDVVTSCLYGEFYHPSIAPDKKQLFVSLREAAQRVLTFRSLQAELS